MITKNNLNDVINQINPKDKKRIAITNKDYIVLELHCFNVGSVTKVILTNDYNRYKNVSNDGNCILESNDVCFNGIK